VPLTMVVADDDPDYRHFVRLLLVPLADTVTIVGEPGGGEEALALALRERPDVVIADLLMPRLNGIELTRRIKHELPRTKIILMTSYPGEANRRLAFVAGADAFLDKAALITGLLPAIRAIVAGGNAGGGTRGLPSGHPTPRQLRIGADPRNARTRRRPIPS
jgi:DNA-binding NarL/FixJ family response regulator